MTGRELVRDALRLIGAVAPGESLGASEATDGLAVLNRMLDSWSTDRLLIYAESPEAPLTLTPGVATVTLGASGDITTRPMGIAKAVIRDASTGQDLPPLKPLTLSEYSSIPSKTTQTPYPHEFYDDGGYPQRTITLYPVPSVANQLVLYTYRPLTQIATIDTAISLPPGYERALVFNLALDLAPEYGKAVSDLVLNTAMESKAAIKRANHRSAALRMDDIPTSNRSGFNIYTGGYNS